MKRQIASWLLLAVFLPMLLLSSLHIHEDHLSSTAECAECVAHHCHGHIGQTSASPDSCVLCQFLSLTFESAAVTLAFVIFNVFQLRYALPSYSYFNKRQGIIVMRGPPVA